MGNRGLCTKVKEGSDQGISDLLEEGKILAGNKYAGMRTAGACLGELTIYLEGKAKKCPPVQNDFEL